MKRATFVTLLVVAAFLIRLAAVLALRDPAAGPPDSADGIDYNLLGTRVAEGLGYTWISGKPTSFRPPGFPLYLAVVYRLFGVDYLVAYVSFCLLGAGSVLFAYLLACEVIGERRARWVGCLAAVYVPHVYFATVFASENLFIFCLGLGLWLFMRHLDGGSLPLLASAGAVLGWGALTRPLGLSLLPPLVIALGWKRQRPWKTRALSALILAASFFLVILPWTGRNYLVHGRPVLVSTLAGAAFYGGNNERVVSEPRHFGGWISSRFLPGRSLIDAMPDEVSHDAMEWKLSLAWLRQHPEAIPRLVLFKFCRLWLPNTDSASPMATLLQVLGYTPMLVLMVVGAARSLRGGRAYRTIPWFVVHSTVLVTVIGALIFWGSPRFRDANMPVLMIYAALGAAAAVERARGLSGTGQFLGRGLSHGRRPGITAVG